MLCALEMDMNVQQQWLGVVGVAALKLSVCAYCNNTEVFIGSATTVAMTMDASVLTHHTNEFAGNASCNHDEAYVLKTTVRKREKYQGFM